MRAVQIRKASQHRTDVPAFNAVNLHHHATADSHPSETAVLIGFVNHLQPQVVARFVVVEHFANCTLQMLSAFTQAITGSHDPANLFDARDQFEIRHRCDGQRVVLEHKPLVDECGGESGHAGTPLWDQVNDA